MRSPPQQSSPALSPHFFYGVPICRFELLLRKYSFPEDRDLQAYLEILKSISCIPTDIEYRILLNHNSEIFAIGDNGQIRELYDRNNQPATMNIGTKVIRRPKPDETFILDYWIRNRSK